MSFLFPTFLIALSAAAVPVVIHLFNFRKFKRLHFTNVKFLQEIRQETDSRSRIKHWLILAARVFTLVFLVLAFARPYIPSGKKNTAGGEHLAGIYVDNSYSMGGSGSEGMLLEQALEKARQIAMGYHLNTRFQLVTNDFKGEHRRWVSRDELLDLLEEVEISPAARTLDEVLLRMKAGFEVEPAAGGQAYIISDFQENFINKRGITADSSFNVIMVPVKGMEFANVAIDSVWFISPAHRAGSLEKLVVRLSNYSDKGTENVPLKLLVNGRQEAIGDVSVPARSGLNDTLTFRSEESGWMQAEVSIVDYPITFDDRFYFSYRVSPEVKVLLINGSGAGNYLEALFGKDEFIRLTANSEDRLNYSLISGQDLVILNRLGNLSTGLAEQLKKFVENGGHTAVFPSLKANLSSYNAFLGQAGADTYSGISTQANEVVRINLQQDIFRDVFERMPRNPDLPSVQTYFKLNKFSRSRKESLLVMRGNDDLIARYASGEGAVYLSAVPLDDSASNFPRHALFVSLLYRMALLSLQYHPLYYTIGADQVVQAGKMDLSRAGSYRIRKENFEMIPSIRPGGAGAEVFVADQIPEPGNYRLVNGEGEELAVFAFNSSKTESDLSYMKEDALENIVTAENISILDANRRSPDRLVNAENFGTPLWKYCVVLALLFLAAEILLIKWWPVAPKTRLNE